MALAIATTFPPMGEIAKGEIMQTNFLDNYYALMKPRVMRLSIFTALVGMALAPGEISVFTLSIATILIALGSGAAGALNMWYDADIDTIMSRTATRPIPLGKINKTNALCFGIALATLSVLLLGLWVNWLAASLLGFTIFFYSVIYTIGLKRLTKQNIVIGGAAGALVPMIGWAVVSPYFSFINIWGSLCLFAIIFLWTPPHFWSLALMRKDEYKQAKVPMLPNISGEHSTRKQILAYSILMFGSSFIPFLLGLTSIFYAICSLVLGAIFLWQTILLFFAPIKNENKQKHKRARNLFIYSIIYLFLLFFILLCEALMRRFDILGAFIL